MTFTACCPVSVGSSANDTRLGVDRPLEPLEPLKLNASDTVSQLPLKDGTGEMGVGGVDSIRSRSF